MAVHWAIRLFLRGCSEAIDSTTTNLSSGGFYCLSPVPLPSDERLTCTLEVPVHDPPGGAQLRMLQCQVLVLRVDAPNVDGLFGIACRIDDYHFAHIAVGQRQ